jgi:hypothetical protein
MAILNKKPVTPAKPAVNFFQRKPKEPDVSIETLFTQMFQELQLPEEKVRAILKENHQEKFKVKDFHRYVVLIRQHMDAEKAGKTYPKVCPICQGPIERMMSRDRHFGVHWGWDCPANRFHFWDDRAHDLAKSNLEHGWTKERIAERDRTLFYIQEESYVIAKQVDQ